MDFDAALKAGYSLSDVNQEAAKRLGFNYLGARKEGYSDEEINKELRSRMGTNKTYHAYLRQWGETEPSRKTAWETRNGPGKIPVDQGNTPYTPQKPLSEKDFLKSDKFPEYASVPEKIGGAFADIGDLGLSLASAPLGYAEAVLTGNVGALERGQYHPRLQWEPKTEIGGKAAAQIGAALQPLLPWGSYLGSLARTRTLKPKGKVFDQKLEELSKKQTPVSPEPVGEPFDQPQVHGEQGPLSTAELKKAAARDEATIRRLEASIARQNPQQPTMPVTHEGQAIPRPPENLATMQDMAAAITRSEQDQLAYFRQQALIKEHEARAAEQARGQIPLRAQQADPFNPYPAVGDQVTMEAMSRAQGDIQYGQIPPGGVVPRNAPIKGITTPRSGEWVVDENGMPVRQNMPETTIDPTPQIIRENQAVHDLGNAIQEANGPLLAPDNPYGSSRLAGPMKGPPPSTYLNSPYFPIQVGQAGLGRGGIKRGALDSSIFTEGYKGVNRWLSRLTEQPWLKHRFPASHYETNSDGTPKVLLHGTAEAFDGKPLVKTGEGVHAGYAVPAHRMASKDGIPSSGGPYRIGNLRYGNQNPKGGIYNRFSDKPAVYPIVIRKGNYPYLDFDMGSWDPANMAASHTFGTGLFRSGLLEHVKHLGYTDESLKTKLNEWWHKNNSKYGPDRALSWANFLANEFNIDGFWYRNSAETAHVPVTSSIPRASRRTFLNQFRDTTKSFVTWDDNNIESIYTKKTPYYPAEYFTGVTRGAIGGTGPGKPMMPRNASETPAATTRREVVNDILGTHHRAPLASAPQIIQAALSEGTDGKGSVLFAAGATLEALKRRSPLIREISRVVQHFKNVAETSIRESVFPFEDRVRKLSRVEIEQVSKILKQEQLLRREFDPASLAELGLSEKQLIAMSKLREMHKSALDVQNQARAARGQKPISPIDAYMAASWEGDFRRIFKDQKGNVVWVLAAHTKFGLNRQTKALLSELPDLTSSDFTVKSARGWRPEYAQTYQTMIDVLGDDPASLKAKAWYESQILADTAHTLGQEKHFIPKGNVRGFVGDRPGKGEFKEGLAYLQQQINYAKNAHKWAGMQQAGVHLKDVLSSKELLDQQPNNLRYAREYFADNLGVNELQWIKALEDSIRDKGISPNAIGKGVGTIKGLWIAQKLAASAGYLASTVLQSANILPTMSHIMTQYGGNPLTAIPAGILTGTAMATSHALGKHGKAVYRALENLPGLPIEFLAKAMKYAEDNNVISKSVYDESPIGSSFGVLGKVDKATRKTITLPEVALRSVAYMTYVSQLKNSKKFTNDLDLFRVADEHVRASMGDYGEGEKAMIFNKFGNVGNAVNVLQTFPINYFNQWSWVTREAIKGNMLPFFTMLGVQYSVAGAMGIPGFVTTDELIEWSKELLLEKSPQLWAKVKDFSLKDLVIRTGGEHSLSGPLSTSTGVSLTTRAAAPNIREMATVPGAPLADAATQLGSLGSAVLDPTNPQKWAQAAYDIAPSGAKGYLETGPLKEFTSATRPDGTTVYGKPSKMSEREGVYARSPEEERLRSFGFQSQKEAMTRDQIYRAQKLERDTKKVLANLPDKVWNELRIGRKDKAKELFQLHVDLSGRGISKEAIVSQIRQEYLTQAERMITKKTIPLEGLLAYKRFQDMMKEMGYAK